MTKAPSTQPAARRRLRARPAEQRRPLAPPPARRPAAAPAPAPRREAWLDTYEFEFMF